MPRQQIDCPICGNPTQKRIVQDGIELDYCDWHGVWLDGGELERLLATYGAGQAPQQARGGQPGMGKAIAHGLAGAAVMGAGFHLGGRLVGGILDAAYMDMPYEWRPVMEKSTRREPAMRYRDADAFHADFAVIRTSRATS